MGITFSGATPADLYPTDIYTNEYDLIGDFPRYPLDLLSDLNGLLGFAYEHLIYPALTTAQLASAVQLPTSAADTLTSYYMVPAEALPLLAPLQLLPVIGQPLYDLVAPDLRILVNLGYGSIDQGWDPGPADVPTTFGVFPTNIDLAELATALGDGLQHGISTAIQDLHNPATYQITPIVDNPSLAPISTAAYTSGIVDTPHPSLSELSKGFLSALGNFPISDTTLQSSPTDIVQDLTATLSADYAALLPVADTLTAFLTTIPAAALDLAADQVADGDLLGAIGEPVAAVAGLLPFLLMVGTGVPVLVATGGTLTNLVDLFS